MIDSLLGPACPDPLRTPWHLSIFQHPRLADARVQLWLDLLLGSFNYHIWRATLSSIGLLFWRYLSFRWFKYHCAALDILIRGLARSLHHDLLTFFSYLRRIIYFIWFKQRWNFWCQIFWRYLETVSLSEVKLHPSFLSFFDICRRRIDTTRLRLPPL